MDRYFLLFFSLLFFLLTGQVSHAQQATVTTGETFSRAAGSISYSVGLIPFNRHITTAGSLTEGLFHIYRVKTSSRVPGTIHYDINIFPNPTPDRINISLEGQTTGNMTAILCDIKGQTLKTIKLQNRHEKTLSLSPYNAGIYFLKILRNGAPMDTYKIIKL